MDKLTDIEADAASTTVLDYLSGLQETADGGASRPQFQRVSSFGSNRVNPRSRIPGDFRTLSIVVTETQEGGIDYKKGNVKDLSEVTWHVLSAQEVCTRLGVSDTRGLDADIAARRLAKNGKNVISKPPRNLAKKIFFYIFGGFGSLLFVASIICFIAWRPLGDPNPFVPNLALAVVLLIVIAIQAIFNAWQDYTTGHVMASIAGLLPSDVLVVRDGQKFKLPAADLVSGDIVSITLGSKVPADLRLLEASSDLRFDRSILTGESNDIAAAVDCTDKNFLESRNIALQGTLCTSGSGVGISDGKVRFGSGSGYFCLNPEPELRFRFSNLLNPEPEPQVQVQTVRFGVQRSSNPRTEPIFSLPKDRHIRKLESS